MGYILHKGTTGRRGGETYEAAGRGIKSTLLRAVGRNIKIPDADYASGTYKIVGGEGIEPPLCHAELSSFNIAFPVHPFS